MEEYEHDAPHSDILPFRKQADEWLNRWLKNDSTPFDEGEIKREEPATLTVLDHQPPDAINEGIYKTFIAHHQLQSWKTLAAWKKRRTELISAMRDQVFRAFPAAKVPFETWKKPEGGWVSRYASASHVEFTTEEGIRVSGQLFVPRGARDSYPALIYVKRAEDIIYPVDYDLLLSALENHVVLLLSPARRGLPGRQLQNVESEDDRGPPWGDRSSPCSFGTFCDRWITWSTEKN